MSSENMTIPVNDIHILNPQGMELPLVSLWSEAPLLLAFLRHFG